MSIWSGIGGLLDTAVNIWNTERTNRSNERSVEETNAQNAANVAAQNAASLQIARENNAVAVQMWERQTAYNSPAEQMKRLEAAGLNPHLVYGTIAESRMATPPSLQAADVAAPHAEATRYDYSGENNPVASYMQVKNAQALNQVQNAEIAKRKAEAVSAVARAKYDAFESDALIRSGTVRSDPREVKLFGRIWDSLADWWKGPDWSKAPKSSSNQGVPWKLVPYVGPDEKAHLAVGGR